MSLIGEALKRARLEAARRDAEERGAVYSEAPAYLPQRRGLSRWPASGVLFAGLALGLVLGVAVFLALRQGENAPPPASAARPEAPVAVTVEHLPPPAGPPTPAGSANEQPAPEPSSAPAEAPAESVSSGRPKPSSPEAPPLAAPPARASRESARPAAEPFASGHSYLRTVVLPSGGRLELDGIVASADAPLTMINRQLLAPGETVEGFTVERIEPNQVTLRRAGGVVIILRLREDPAG